MKSDEKAAAEKISNEEILTVEQQAIANQIKALIDIVPMISNLGKELNNRPRDLNFMANTAFVTRKTVEILKKIKSQLEELEEKVAEQACLTMAQFNLPNHSSLTCTITPNPEPYVKYPASPEHDGYEEFVKQLPTNCIRPHYPSIGEAIVEALQDGGPLPWGLNKKQIQSVNWKLRLRGKRDL